MSIFNPDLVSQFSKMDDYFNQHFTKLNELIATVEATQTIDHYKRLSGSVVLDASGNGQVPLLGPQGYGMSLQVVSLIVAGGATVGTVTLHSNSVAPGTVIGAFQPSIAGTIAGIGQVVMYVAYDPDIYVSDQEQLLVQFSGFTANAEAYVNIQSKLLKESVHMSKHSSYSTGEY